MNKQEIERMVKSTVKSAIESQKMLTRDEKIGYLALAAVGIAVVSAIQTQAKICAMNRRVKKCERKIEELESFCTEP